MNRHPYTVLQWTQHWRLINGRWYRDALARRPDGTLGMIAFPDEAAA